MLQNPLKDIVPQGTVKNGSWKALCNCCPYGYHIDLDFVQYCEALSRGRELAIGKQQRRERRRQRQSMEVLLGLTSPLVWNLEQQLPMVPAELSPPEPSPDSAYTNAIVQDALHRAVLDFEETLHRSQPRSVISSTVLEIECPREKTIGEETDDLGQGSSMHHAESVSSVSSMSMASSLVTPEKNNTQSIINHNIPHDDTGLLQDFDVASVGSAASGLSTGALQNIREQMAISLERMRELEEQVKLIPVLQVQLSVLKEEKRKMLLQVRLEEAERSKINIGSDSSTGPVILGDEDKYIPEPSMRVRSHSCSEGSDRYYTQNSSFSQIKSNLRDVGVTCSVVTREVGVSPQQPKLRSVKTNTHIPFSQLGIDDNKTEGFLPNLSYYQKNPVTTPSRTKLVKVSPVSINISPILNKVITKSTAMNTDLVMNNIYSDVEMDKNINKAIQIYEKTIDSCLHFQNGRDFGVQVDKTPEVAPVLLIVERRDVAVQFENMHCYIDAFSQTEELSRHLVDVGILARPSSSHTLIQVKAKTRDIGISENSVFDVLCDKCKVKKQSIGVGHNFMNVLSKDEAAISLSNIGIMRNVTSDSPVPSSRTIGCNTSNCTLVNRGTNTRDYSMGKRDFGVNTAKRKLVDAAIGDNTIHRNSDAGVFLCDKCDAVIQNVAKHMLTKNADPHVPSADVAVIPLPTTSSNFKSPSVTLSRIPRPASSTTSSRSATTSVTTSTGTNEKHRIQRQDTYTKLQISTENLQKTQLSTQEKASYGCEISPICPVERLLAMEASRSQELEEEHTAEREQDLSGSETEEMTRRNPQEETHSSMDPGLFQPIQQDTRKKMEPSKEMKAALKVLNDYLRKSPFSTVPRHLKNATNIIQQEWFKISSTASANPLDVEDYLDCFEEMSSSLLEYIVNMTDISGNTAMHYAVSHGNFDVVSILLDSKVCNINRPNAAGYTCVMLVSLAQVCSDTHRQVVRRLFQLADVNVRAKQHGQTALMLAVSHGRLDMVRLLVEAGADTNIQDEDGSTALMCAAEHGHTAIVKHLLSQQDCDVSIVDCDGSTALNIAMDAGNKDIGVLLYAHEHFSRGSSPYTSLRHRRSKSATPTMLSTTPPSPSPVRERLSRHEQTM